MDEVVHGVGFNVVNPSLTYTAMAEGMQGQPELVAKIEQVIPFRRGTQSDDIAGATAFLASEDAR